MDLFSSLSQQDSLIMLTFVISAFLIGYLLSWIAGARQAAKWKPEAQKAGAELKALQAEYQSFKDQFSLREADMQGAQVEAEENKRQLKNLQEERRRLMAELEENRAELVRLEASVTAQQETIEDLNDQISGIQPRKEESPMDTVLQRLTAVEEKLQRLESTPQPTSRNAEAAVEKLFEAVEAEEEEEADDETRIAAAREYLRAALPPAAEGQKDDLQKIEGIGPFIEKQLNEAGVCTYEQISHLDEALIGYLTTAIGFFPGRIEKDDWVGQARQLLQPHAGLQLVEGIGPKIEAILEEAGIKTLQDLAQTEVERLVEILSQAGERYRLHDPSTWPEQAQMAVAGEWDRLTEFKEFLDGRRLR